MDGVTSGFGALNEVMKLTLLAAAYLDGRFAAISDRRNVYPRDNSARADYYDKWTPVPVETARAVWGWSGWSDVGCVSAGQVKRSASDWATLRTVLCRALGSMCQQVPTHQSECLVAGWLQGVPGIVHFRFDGTTEGWDAPTDIPPTTDRFVGVRSYGADLAWKYATECLRADRSTNNFRAVLDLVIHEEALLNGFAGWDVGREEMPVRVEAVEPPLGEPPYFPPPPFLGGTS